MKIQKIKQNETKLENQFRDNNEKYFKEHPTHKPYISYGEDAYGNAVHPYIGIEDENGNAITGYDEPLS